ncbi:lytic transglycosylase domain-containing protein [Streptomyces sp. NPDC005408]|uniref:lytic transglycosylase domain-containing protein n=1 Tax=Streptomyces sp. NPDC005408 TaxID=3155341 RepID=UPI0033BAD05C
MDGTPGRSAGVLVSRRRARARSSQLWSRALAGLVAVGATGGMATATVWQLAGQSPAMAAPVAPVAADRGGGTPPLYPEPPPAMLYVPETRPVPWNTPSAAKAGGRGGFVAPRLPAAYGIPGRVLAAYRGAVRTLARTQPGCGLEVALLAAIGRVESGHARGGDLDANGVTRTPILGPRLDGGPGVMAIRDTDGGVHDGDRVWDRAVGPAQFIPSTWRRWGSDGNGDAAADPHQIDDAWLAAGRYLCAAGGDLRGGDGLRRAVLAYNHSEDYLHLVLSWMRVYTGYIVPGAAAAPDRASSQQRGEPSSKGRPSPKPGASPAKPAPTAPPADKDPSAPTGPPDASEPARPRPAPGWPLPVSTVPIPPPGGSGPGGLAAP